MQRFKIDGLFDRSKIVVLKPTAKLPHLILHVPTFSGCMVYSYNYSVYYYIAQNFGRVNFWRMKPEDANITPDAV